MLPVLHNYLVRLWRETRGQDMIEYALMAATVAVSAGAILPPVTSSFSAIFSKVGSIMSRVP